MTFMGTRDTKKVKLNVKIKNFNNCKVVAIEI